MAFDQVPFVTKELVEYLERIFPNKMPTHELSQFELGKLAGGVQVTEVLRMLYEEQIRSSLGN